MKRYILFAPLTYCYPILRPVQEEIRRRGDEAAWYIGYGPDMLQPGEKKLATIEEAIAYVRQYHYIDDKRYAVNYLGSRGKLKSRRQVEQELLYKKGVAKDVLEEVFSEAEPQDERAMIRRWMEKKRMDPQTATREELRKFYLFLARRGFQSEDILHELRRQNGEIPQAE